MSGAETGRRFAASRKPAPAERRFADLGVPVTTALAVLVLAIVAVTGSLGERRLGQTVASALGFLGLCVLPVFMMLFGAFTTVERSKSIAFCHSCHAAMNPYVSDMKDPVSTTSPRSTTTSAGSPKASATAATPTTGCGDRPTRSCAASPTSTAWATIGLGAARRGEADPLPTRPYQANRKICLGCHAGGASFCRVGPRRATHDDRSSEPRRPRSQDRRRHHLVPAPVTGPRTPSSRNGRSSGNQRSAPARG